MTDGVHEECPSSPGTCWCCGVGMTTDREGAPRPRPKLSADGAPINNESTDVGALALGASCNRHSGSISCWCRENALPERLEMASCSKNTPGVYPIMQEMQKVRKGK
jgi:hypothetical protein